MRLVTPVHRISFFQVFFSTFWSDKGFRLHQPYAGCPLEIILFLTLLSPSVQALAAAERARKQAETERDELSEEMASNSSGK